MGACAVFSDLDKSPRRNQWDKLIEYSPQLVGLVGLAMVLAGGILLAKGIDGWK